MIILREEFIIQYKFDGFFFESSFMSTVNSQRRKAYVISILGIAMEIHVDQTDGRVIELNNVLRTMFLFTFIWA